MIFTSSHQWDDIRIYHKQARSLAQKYEVEYHAPAPFGKKTIHNIFVNGLPMWKKKSDRIKIILILFKRILKSKADVFHFHDPELLIHGLILKVFRRKKVIFDMHENLSLLINDRKWIPVLFKIPIRLFYKAVEKLSVILFDKIILAEESYKEIIPNNSVTILNYPLVHKAKNNTKKMTDAIYVGGVLEERGARELLEITKQVSRTFPDFTMKIIGPISSILYKELLAIVREYQLEENVFIAGRLDYISAMKEVEQSKIGLALLHPIGNYMKSIPTKLFEYMQFSIPFIASDFYYWKEYFRGCQVGYFIAYNDLNQWTNRIVKLLSDQNLLHKIGKAGKKLVLQNYSWASEEEKLFVLYCELIEP